jgi:regulator of PEP synthase PpsR (kinase-PPPase family)
MAVCHLHLVSDATGETVNSVARACAVQFEGIEPVEHTWMLIRTKGQIEKALKGIAAEPGPVLFTLVNRELRIALVDGCRKLGVPCIAVLDPIMHALAAHLNLEIRGRPGLQHVLDSDYYPTP